MADHGTLVSLTSDVLNVIIANLPYREYHNLACTNKNINQVCKSENVIRQRLLKEFPKTAAKQHDDQLYERYTQLVYNRKKRKIVNGVLKLMCGYSDDPGDDMFKLNEDLEGFSSTLRIKNQKLIGKGKITKELIRHITHQTSNFDLLYNDDGIIYCHKVNNLFYRYCFNYRYLRYKLRDHLYLAHEYMWEKIM